MMRGHGRKPLRQRPSSAVASDTGSAAAHHMPRSRYVIETFNCWAFWTNWAAGSEELMLTTN
jgi:hypothetical protein